MIPFDFITEWRRHSPWIQDAQIEQDLIISRALTEMFGQDRVAVALAFRGGTALYKLHMQAVRYSDDIDLVQTTAGPIGPVLDAIRGRLDPWLGDPKRTLKESTAALVYRIQSEGAPPIPMRLKIEINTREHFSVLGFVKRAFTVESRWFSGSAQINTYRIDELLGTKMRALYQRKKGRDLFDLWYAGRRMAVDADRVVDCFRHYLAHEGLRVSRAEFEANLEEKLSDGTFLNDIAPLLSPDCPLDFEDAARYVREELLPRLPGEVWKGSTGTRIAKNDRNEM